MSNTTESERRSWIEDFRRFNYYVPRGLWNRLTAHAKARSDEIEGRVRYSSIITKALDRYLKAHGK